MAAGDPPAGRVVEEPARETREALWAHAGIVRDRRGSPACSTPRTTSCGGSPPTRCCARRRRGAHARRDFPRTDPRLDGHHTVTTGDAEAPVLERWD